MGKLGKRKKRSKKVSDCFRHSCIFEKNQPLVAFEKRKKFLKLIESGIHINFAKRHEVLKHLFTYVLS